MAVAVVVPVLVGSAPFVVAVAVCVAAVVGVLLDVADPSLLLVLLVVSTPAVVVVPTGAVVVSRTTQIPEKQNPTRPPSSHSTKFALP